MARDTLQVVRIEQNEGGYPRIESRAFFHELWLVKLLAAQHSVPSPPLLPERSGAAFEERWEALIEATEAVLRADPYQGTSVAGAGMLDFRERRGRARGNVAVYAFTAAGVRVCYDASVGSSFGEAERQQLDPSYLDLALVNITPRGTEGPESVVEDFSFADAKSVLVSTEPLHWWPWWPPPSIDQAVAAVLASCPSRDLALALWSPEAAGKGRES